jgi:hypothetical protein
MSSTHPPGVSAAWLPLRLCSTAAAACAGAPEVPENADPFTDNQEGAPCVDGKVDDACLAGECCGTCTCIPCVVLVTLQPQSSTTSQGSLQALQIDVVRVVLVMLQLQSPPS